MALIEVALTISIMIVMNIIVPSFDVFSDIKLSFDTVNYELTDEYELYGCRYCYHPESKYHNDIEVHNTCKTCISSPIDTRGNPSLNCSNSIFALKALLKMTKATQCSDKNLRLPLRGGSFLEEDCQSSDECCITNDEMSQSVSRFVSHGRVIKTCACQDISTLGYETNISKADSCQACILSGRSSCSYCISLSRRKSIKEKVFDMINTLEATNCGNASFKLNSADTGQNAEKGVSIQRNFTHMDQCGILFTKTENKNDVHSNRVCGIDFCTAYFDNVGFSVYTNDLRYEKWKSMMKYSLNNVRHGGKICKILSIYGYSTMIPLLLNLMLHAILFYKDLKMNGASYYDAIPILFLIYPQYKCVKIIIQYFIHNDSTKNGIIVFLIPSLISVIGNTITPTFLKVIYNHKRMQEILSLLPSVHYNAGIFSNHVRRNKFKIFNQNIRT